MASKRFQEVEKKFGKFTLIEGIDYCCLYKVCLQMFLKVHIHWKLQICTNCNHYYARSLEMTIV